MSPKQDSEKNMVLCTKGDDITSFDGTGAALATLPKISPLKISCNWYLNSFSTSGPVSFA
jgi:hypothetical protein